MTTQPEALLEAELLAQLQSMGYVSMALDAKVAGVALAAAAAQRWKKGLFADVRVEVLNYDSSDGYDGL